MCIILLAHPVFSCSSLYCCWQITHCAKPLISNWTGAGSVHHMINWANSCQTQYSSIDMLSPSKVVSLPLPPFFYSFSGRYPHAKFVKSELCDHWVDTWVRLVEPRCKKLFHEMYVDFSAPSEERVLLAGDISVMPNSILLSLFRKSVEICAFLYKDVFNENSWVCSQKT